MDPSSRRARCTKTPFFFSPPTSRLCKRLASRVLTRARLQLSYETGRSSWGPEKKELPINSDLMSPAPVRFGKYDPPRINFVCFLWLHVSFYLYHQVSQSGQSHSGFLRARPTHDKWNSPLRQSYDALLLCCTLRGRDKVLTRFAHEIAAMSSSTASPHVQLF